MPDNRCPVPCPLNYLWGWELLSGGVMPQTRNSKANTHTQHTKSKQKCGKGGHWAQSNQKRACTGRMIDTSGWQIDSVHVARGRLTLFNRFMHRLLTGSDSLTGTEVSYIIVRMGIMAKRCHWTHLQLIDLVVQSLLQRH